MRVRLERKPVLFLVLVLAASSLPALDVNKLPPDNWAVKTSPRGLTTMGDIHGPVPFVGITPCRIADTRNPAGPYGAPALAGGVPRNFTLTGQCGIPAGALSVSLNLTVTNTAGPGFILIYPAGGSQPTVSTLNYVAGQTIANAAIVPLGTGGAVTVIAGVSGTNFIIDTNGYFPASLNNGEGFNQSGNVFGGIVFGENANTFGFPTSGVRGYLDPTATGKGAAGVLGEAHATTGAVYGVYGLTHSTTGGGPNISGGAAAGVLGLGPSGFPAGSSNQPAGVLGASNGNIAVQGDAGPLAVGVRGQSFDSAGNFINLGILGFPGGGYGVYSNSNYGGVGAKYFVEPHPTDPSKIIRFVALEGNESGTYFRGSAQTVNGTAVIPVPEEFRMVTDDEDLTVQLTPVGAAASMYILSEDLNHIVVRSNRDVKFHYQVNGVRRAFKDHQSIVDAGQEFIPYSVASPAGLVGYPEEIKRRLIANGTYNADGSVNIETARRLGWTKIWEEQAKGAVAKPKTE